MNKKPLDLADEEKDFGVTDDRLQIDIWKTESNKASQIMGLTDPGTSPITVRKMPGSYDWVFRNYTWSVGQACNQLRVTIVDHWNKRA